MSRIEFQIVTFVDAIPEQFPDNTDDMWGYYCLFTIRINGKLYYKDYYFDVFNFISYVNKWKEETDNADMYYESEDLPFIAFKYTPEDYKLYSFSQYFDCTDTFSKQQICNAIDALVLSVKKMIHGNKEKLSFDDIEKMLKENGYEYSVEGSSERVIRINSNNGHYDLLIVFHKENSNFYLEDMHFGLYDFSYNNLCCDVKLLLQVINEDIEFVKSGELKVIIKQNKKGVSEIAVYNHDCNDWYYINLVKESHKPKSILGVLFNIDYHYELFDWFNYESVNR